MLTHHANNDTRKDSNNNANCGINDNRVYARGHTSLLPVNIVLAQVSLKLIPQAVAVTK